MSGTLTESPAASALRVYFPAGATVSVAVTDHRRARSGTSRTMVLVTGALDGRIGNVSGMVASVTAYRRTAVDPGEDSARVIVSGYGDRRAAVRALVSDLARELHGSSTALRLHVL